MYYEDIYMGDRILIEYDYPFYILSLFTGEGCKYFDSKFLSYDSCLDTAYNEIFLKVSRVA